MSFKTILVHVDAYPRRRRPRQGRRRFRQAPWFRLDRAHRGNAAAFARGVCGRRRRRQLRSRGCRTQRHRIRFRRLRSCLPAGDRRPRPRDRVARRQGGAGNGPGRGSQCRRSPGDRPGRPAELRRLPVPRCRRTPGAERSSPAGCAAWPVRAQPALRDRRLEEHARGQARHRRRPAGARSCRARRSAHDRRRQRMRTRPSAMPRHSSPATASTPGSSAPHAWRQRSRRRSCASPRPRRPTSSSRAPTATRDCANGCSAGSPGSSSRAHRWRVCSATEAKREAGRGRCSASACAAVALHQVLTPRVPDASHEQAGSWRGRAQICCCSLRMPGSTMRPTRIDGRQTTPRDT